MDISNDNNDTNMADSNNDNNDMGSLLNDNNNSNEKGGDGIDDGINHERLRELSNYADQNQDNPSWYWNTTYGNLEAIDPPAGWPVYRPLSDLSEVEREEIRVGETRMVSRINNEGNGITLKWGEYYVADDEMSRSSNNEESSLSEAEEIDDDEALIIEEEQALSLVLVGIPQAQTSSMNYDQLDRDVDAPTVPTLMGMPDIILEKILHYSTEKPSEVCVVELVCKRIRRLATGDDFWARKPFWLDKPHRYSLDTRKSMFAVDGLFKIRKYQKGTANAILDVLRDEEGGWVADTFRTILVEILSRMNHLVGPEVHFRLRGDTIGYICELLQGYMIRILENALLLAIHRLEGAAKDINRTVQRDDIALAFQKDSFSPFFCGVTQRPTSCNVSMGVHGQGLAPDCSCSLPSSSGIIWKWPGDNCHDVLPTEAGRRIIRRLAYQASIREMSNEAFILAEAELLHALGVLLVSAYESSVEMAKTAQFLDEEDELVYNEQTDSVDMFNAPPPPFQKEQLVYTIVPGQIRTAAEERDISPSHVYGDVWVSSSGFTKEEEEEIERSYYYEDESSSEDDESGKSSCSEGIKSKAKQEKDDDNGNDSDTSVWSECSSVEDSEMDMDDYEEDCYLAEYRLGSQEIEAHYNHFPEPNNLNGEEEVGGDEGHDA